MDLGNRLNGETVLINQNLMILNFLMVQNIKLC
jgi:hypothetical protein